MYSFLFNYKLDSTQKRDAFLAELLDAHIPEICSAEEGCNMYRYYLPVGSDCEIGIVESWISEEAQKIHCTQPHCAIIRALKEKYGVESSMTAL